MLQDFFFKYMWLCFALLLKKKLMKKSKLDFCFFSTQIKGSLYSPTKINGLCVCYRICSLLRYYIVEGYSYLPKRT